MNGITTRGRNIVTVLVVIAVIIIAIILILSLSRGNEEVVTPDTDTTEQPDENDTGDLITVRHQFVDGEHTVVGEIPVPTPCHLLDWETVVDDQADPDNVMINFTTTLEEEEDQVCAQVITPRRFKAVFEAEENANISAELNGQPIELNIMEAEEGEDLSEFEVDVKG